jgi:hypothetical protein
MVARSGDFSPRILARVGGALYLVIIALGLFAEVFVRGRLIVGGDAAATAARIVESEALWRSGIVAEYVAGFATLGLALVYFLLFEPVSRPLNLLATFFRLVAIAVQTVAVLFLVVAPLPLGSSSAWAAVGLEVRQATARLAIQAHTYGYSVALLFFGVGFLISGHLVARSGFLPRFLGVLLRIAGLCYMASSLALLGAPALLRFIDPYWMLGPFVGELSMSLWLLIRGVDEARWLALAERRPNPGS